MTKNNESMKLKIYISIYTHILCYRNKNHENWSKVYRSYSFPLKTDRVKMYISIYTHILCFCNKNHENWSNSCGDIIKKV